MSSLHAIRFSKRTCGALLICALFEPVQAFAAGSPRPYLEAAYQTERWIRISQVRTAQSTQWLAQPLDPHSASYDLYTGMAGVVLFYLELYQQTRDPALGEDLALSGSRALAAHMALEEEAGLYRGLAGTCFVLGETYRLFPRAEQKKNLLNCVHLLHQRAGKTSFGVSWNDANDVIGGSAGIGLTLLYIDRLLKDKASVDLAVQAGRHLIERGRPEAGGLKWTLDSTFPKIMPNFSHGTAGVAYFLASLYQRTRKKEFLNAALAGARYLLAVAKKDGQACLIFHNELDGKDLYYLSWCHGPAGTARLFYRLYQVTGDTKWMDWVTKSAHGILTSGIPEKRTPGFWNNAGQCCGNAGVAEFFLDLYRLKRRPEYLAFARRVTDDVLARAAREGQGGETRLKWPQAEHRLNPALLIAQTGYMQGAAGIGIGLLHLDAAEHGKRPFVRLPDNPF